VEIEAERARTLCEKLLCAASPLELFAAEIEPLANRVHAEQAVVHALATQTASENVSQAFGSPAV